MRGKPSSVANCDLPQCASCNFGKAQRHSSKAKTTILNKDKENEIKKQHLLPGQKVSADQYVSAVPGRLYTSRESESSKDKLCGWTIFVDHASGYIDVRHQPTLSATGTVRSKLEFESDAENCNVQVKSYHTDNGVFTAKDFYKIIE